MSEEEKEKEDLMASIIGSFPEDYQIGNYIAKVGKKSIWIMASDGIYNIINNNVFTATFHVAELNIPGLPSGKDLQKFRFNLPKIPYSLFKRLILFYRHIHDLYGTEVFVALYYDRINEKWNFEIPKQKVSGGSAEWETKSTSKFNDTNNIFAMETHSHHTMFGHFSTIDDADQQLPERIHLVIGKIKDNQVEYTMRVKNKKHVIELDLKDVFEGSPDVVLIDRFEDFPNWNENIEKNSKLTFIDGEFENDKLQDYTQSWNEDEYYSMSVWNQSADEPKKKEITDEEDYTHWYHL